MKKNILIYLRTFLTILIVIHLSVTSSKAVPLSAREKFIQATATLNKLRFDIGQLVKEAKAQPVLNESTVQSLANALAILESFDYWLMRRMIENLVANNAVIPENKNLWSQANIASTLQRFNTLKEDLKILLKDKKKHWYTPQYAHPHYINYLRASLPQLFQEPELTLESSEINPRKRLRTQAGYYQHVVPSAVNTPEEMSESEPMAKDLDLASIEEAPAVKKIRTRSTDISH